MEKILKLEDQSLWQNSVPFSHHFESLIGTFTDLTKLSTSNYRDSAPAEWARLQVLMDHDEERRKEKVYWNMFQVKTLLEQINLL